MNLIATKRFDRIEDLFDYLAPWQDQPTLYDHVFRGHGQESYELIPNSLRPERADSFWKIAGSKPGNGQWQWDFSQVQAEYELLRSFYRLADRRGLEVPLSPQMRANLAADHGAFDRMSPMNSGGVWIPSDLHETAALAQHYGIPTRLLDWTHDLYVALYFAFIDGIDKDGDLAIWALNKWYLLYLKTTDKRTSIEFITPHYAGNPNLGAQQGLFTHWPITIESMAPMAKSFDSGGTASLVDRRPLDQLIGEQLGSDPEQSIFRKFVLPCSEARAGRRILGRLGYSAARLFPGYSGVAKDILSRHA